MTKDLNQDLLSDLIDRDLADMNADILIPGGVQNSWRVRLEEERMEKRTPKKAWRNWLAAAAAVVFVLGGTYLSGGLNSALMPQAVPAPMADYGGGTGRAAEYDYSYNYEAESGAAQPQMTAKSTALSGGAGQEATQEKRIKTVDITLSTLGFDISLKAIEDAAQQSGGYISYQSVSGEKSARRWANIDLRIPEASLDAFIAAALNTGSVTAQTQSVTDMTENYYDLAARLKTQESKMERLQALLTETATLTEILEWESAIADTQYTIDSLKAQMQSIDDKVAYSRVSIYLNEEKGADVLPNSDLPLQTRILEGIKASLNGIVLFLKAALVFVISALPFIGIIVILWIVIMGVRKLVRKKTK